VEIKRTFSAESVAKIWLGKEDILECERSSKKKKDTKNE